MNCTKDRPCKFLVRYFKKVTKPRVYVIKGFYKRDVLHWHIGMAYTMVRTLLTGLGHAYF